MDRILKRVILQIDSTTDNMKWMNEVDCNSTKVTSIDVLKKVLFRIKSDAFKKQKFQNLTI